MAKYTIQIKNICESLAGNTSPVGLSNLDETLEKARTKIFDFTYPFYDASSKADFEKWILESVYMEEINYETYGLWHLKVRNFMKTNMPYYNKLFESANMIVNPLKNHHLERTTTSTDKSEGTSNGTGASNVLAWNMYSDTPQGGINGLENSTYLTNATKDLNDTTTTTDSTSTTNSTSNGKEVTDGYSGIDENTLLLKYRSTIININQQFINDFKDKLTLKLWY